MRRLIFLTALFLSAADSFAAIYYVDATNGVDAQSGLTPALAWKTIAKVNGIATFAGDDSILLKRGEVWAEKLRPTSAGSAGHQITFGAYGVGAPPVLTLGIDTNARSYLTLYGLVADGAVIISNSSTGTIINYCISKNSSTYGIRFFDSPAGVINNSVVVGSVKDGILGEGATTVLVIKNCIVSSNGALGQTTQYGITTMAASVTYSYSTVTGNNNQAQLNVGAGVTDGGNNQAEIIPRFVRGINGNAYFVFTIDDLANANLPYAADVAAVLASYGGRLTGFAFPAETTAGFYSYLTALVAGGHEIGVHSWSHSGLTATDGFSITSTNTLPTVQVDVAGQQIILSCTEVGNRVTISTAAANTSVEWKAVVLGKGWTITNGTHVGAAMNLAALADTAGSVAVPATVLLDVSAPNYAYWREEIVDARDWVTARTGVVPTTLSYPWGENNVAVQTYIKDVAGLMGARSIVVGLTPLNSLSMYATNVYQAATAYIVGGGTEAEVRAHARHYFERARQLGGVFTILAHTAAEMSIQQVTWFVDEIYKSGATFVTYGSALAAIRADHSTADGLTYTKTYPDVSDFSLRPYSPAIGAGVDVGLTTDILGNPLRGTVDIGAFESAGVLGQAPMGVRYYPPLAAGSPFVRFYPE